MSEMPFLSRREAWLQRIADEIATALSRRIRDGRIGPGEVLPDREALAAEFLTGRSVIDFAIKALVAEKLVVDDLDVSVHVRRARPPATLHIPRLEDATRDDILGILELRMGIEAQSAELAAVRRTDAQLAAIRIAQADFDAAAETVRGLAQANFRFHISVAEASGNPYLRDLAEHLGPLLIPRMRVDLGAADATRAARAEHRRLVEAIAAGDSDAARQAMRAHLGRSMELVRDLKG